MRELVFNEAVWSGSGLPVNDDVGEEPLVPPVLNFSNQGSGQAAGSQYDLDAPLVPPSLFSAMAVHNQQCVGDGQPLIPPVINYAEISRQNGHSFDRSGLGVPPRVGRYPQDEQYGSGAPPRAPFNSDYEERLEESNRENKRRLGLLDEGEPLVPPNTMSAIIRDSRQRARK
jgi:hypothetical protein